jgi:hypothetical protein
MVSNEPTCTATLGSSSALGGAVGDAVGTSFYDFFSATSRKPVALAFGTRAWDWTGKYPRSQRSSDALTVISGDCSNVIGFEADPAGTPLALLLNQSGGSSGSNSSDCVMLELNIAAVNHWSAFMGAGMVLFVITELVLISALLTAVTNRIVVFPLERIFDTIKSNMDKIMGAFGGKIKGGDGDGDDDDDAEDGGMGAMEAAIEKMTRLVKHVAGSGAQGNHMFNEYVNDANMDDNTRAWLMDMNGRDQGGGEGGGDKAKDLKPSPSLGAAGGAAAAKAMLSSPNNSRNGSMSQHESLHPGVPSFNNHKRISEDGEDGAAAASAAAFDDSMLDSLGDDDYYDFNPNDLPLKAGPELQLRQARQRSRTRAYAASAAAAAAADNDIRLPANIDQSLINTWDFDVLSLTSEEMRSYVLLMFGSLGLLRSDDGITPAASLYANAAALEGFCSTRQLWNFLVRVEGGYRVNAYHNFQHAVDVTHTVYRYIVLTEPRTHITSVEKFALMVAALSHDLDHPGVNNAFLVNTKDRLATVYNDSSVLENSHIACLYNLINTRQTRGQSVSARKDSVANAGPDTPGSPSHPQAQSQVQEEDDANIFAALDDTLYREVRRIIIATVLHTAGLYKLNSADP